MLHGALLRQPGDGARFGTWERFCQPNGRGYRRPTLTRRREAGAFRGRHQPFLSLALARGDGGGPAPVVAQFHCIGPRKKEERRLADADARFRRAFEGSAIGIGLLALPGSAVVQANNALCSMLQRHREDLLGSDLLSLVDPADIAGMKALLSGLRNRRDPASSRELRFAVGPQQVLWALVSAAQVDGDRGIRRHALVQVVDIAAQKETELALRHQSLHDPLTGLPNRLLLFDRLRQALARNQRRPGSVVLVYLDLDHFKSINDALGHDAGDRLLVEVAARLKGAVRPADTVARIGGDEFVVLAEGLQRPEQMNRLLRRLRKALAAPVGLMGEEVTVKATVGIAMASEGADPLDLLREADRAMYRAKRERASGIDPPGASICLEFRAADLLALGRIGADLLGLADLGVRFGVDDVGADYERLTDLSWLPIEFVKLDGLVVAGLVDRAGKELVAGALGLSRLLGLITIAEAVERPGQAKALKKLGCDLAQGHLFGPPAPAEQISAIFAGAVPGSEPRETAS